MFRFLVVGFVAGCVFSGSPALARAYGVYGAGNYTCADFSIAQQNDDKDWMHSPAPRKPGEYLDESYGIYENYVTGVMTAVSYLTGQITNLDIQVYMDEIAALCSDYPSEVFSDAVFTVLQVKQP